MRDIQERGLAFPFAFRTPSFLRGTGVYPIIRTISLPRPLNNAQASRPSPLGTSNTLPTFPGQYTNFADMLANPTQTRPTPPGTVAATPMHSQFSEMLSNPTQDRPNTTAPPATPIHLQFADVLANPRLSEDSADDHVKQKFGNFDSYVLEATAGLGDDKK